MLNKNQIISILGEDRVYEVTSKLTQKHIDQATIDRVLDYLALNSIAFPYLDNKELGNKLCRNLNSSIVFNDFKKSLSAMLKFRCYGYATNSRIVLNTKPFKFIFPKKYFQTMTDALIRHELDHIATTNTKVFDIDDYRKFLHSQATAYQQLFDTNLDKEYLIDDIEKSITFKFHIPKNRRYNQEITTTRITNSGVGGECFRFAAHNQTGSTSLNEGITALKMKKLDKVAGQGGFFCQSGYMLEEAVAQDFADNIGEETLIKLQSEGDFFEIVRLYKEKTGKSGKFMHTLFDRLSHYKPKSMTAKMIKQIKFAINHNINTDLQNLYAEDFQNSANE